MTSRSTTVEAGEARRRRRAASAAPRKIRALTADDWLSLVGSVLSSFALVDDRLRAHLGRQRDARLPLLLVSSPSCWSMRAWSAMSNPRHIVVERLVTATLYLAATAVVFALGTTVVYTFAQRLARLCPRRLLHPRHVRREPDGAAERGRDPPGDRRHGHRGGNRRRDLGAAGHRHGRLHVRGRRTRFAARADGRRGHDGVAGDPGRTVRLRDPHRWLRASEVGSGRLRGHGRHHGADHRPGRRGRAPGRSQRASRGEQRAGRLPLEDGAQGRAAERAGGSGHRRRSSPSPAGSGRPPSPSSPPARRAS